MPGKCLPCHLLRGNSRDSALYRYAHTGCPPNGVKIHFCPAVCLFYLNYIIIEIRRVPHTVDAGHGRHHHHVLPSRQQGRGGSQPQFVNLFINGQILFYIGVAGRQVCFRLVIVIIRYIVFHCIVGKETLELSV